MAETKTYKVLKRLGWDGGTYVEGDSVEMPENWAEYYIGTGVLEELSSTASDVITPEVVSPQLIDEEEVE